MASDKFARAAASECGPRRLTSHTAVIMDRADTFGFSAGNIKNGWNGVPNRKAPSNEPRTIENRVVTLPDGKRAIKPVQVMHSGSWREVSTAKHKGSIRNNSRPWFSTIETPAPRESAGHESFTCGSGLELDDLYAVKRREKTDAKIARLLQKKAMARKSAKAARR